jgi:hypothetical protein
MNKQTERRTNGRTWKEGEGECRYRQTNRGMGGRQTDRWREKWKDRQMDSGNRQMDRWTEGQRNGGTDNGKKERRMEGKTDGRTDR